MTDQSAPVDPAHSQPPLNEAQASAKKLAEETIDATSGLAKLAVHIPEETARLVLDAAEALIEKLKDVLPENQNADAQQ